MAMRALLITLLAVAGCSFLSPVRDDSRYYVLNAVTDSDQGSPTALRPELIVGVGPVAIPQYLEHTEIVARGGANQLVALPNARWGEPLQPNLTRVIAENLAVDLGTAQVVVFPWFGGAQPSYTVAVNVQRFELQEDGVVRLHARWTLRDVATRATITSRDTSVDEPAKPNDGGAATAAMSRAAAGLSKEIASAIRDAQRPTVSKPATDRRGAGRKRRH